MVRPQHNDLKGGLQDREPSLRRINRDSKVTRNVGEIEQLASPARKYPQETLKRDQVTELENQR